MLAPLSLIAAVGLAVGLTSNPAKGEEPTFDNNLYAVINAVNGMASAS
jgi:hypothetical protein